MDTTLVGIVGGAIGSDPFDRRTFSGCSYHLFTALKNRGCLHRAFGGKVPPFPSYYLAAMNYNRNRASWRRGYFLDRRYRENLSRDIVRQLTPQDYEHPIIQVGAQFNVAQYAASRTKCYSYHDSNLAMSLADPVAGAATPKRRVKEAFDYERDVYRSVEKVLAISDWVRDSFIDDFGIPAEKVVTVGGGANLSEIPEYNPNKDYETQEILFIGIEFERKGGRILLRAFQAARERFPKARLHIVGPKDLDLSAEEARGVVYHGYLSRSVPEEWQVLAGLFARSSLFVMPSLYEPFGMSRLEAMLYQIPALVTDGWGIKERIVPGENGDLLALGDADDLAQKMEFYLSRPDKLRAMGEAGRKLVLEHYTWDRVAQKIACAIT